MYIYLHQAKSGRLTPIDNNNNFRKKLFPCIVRACHFNLANAFNFDEINQGNATNHSG